MKLSKIRILNYKSIKDVTIDVRPFSKSYATFFVGKNETGKTNILEAIKFLSEPQDDFNFEALKNAQNDSDNSINFYYTYSFENEAEWKNVLNKTLSLPDELFSNIHVLAIEKNIYLSIGCSKIKSRNNVLTSTINEVLLSRFCYKKIDNSEIKYEIKYEKDVNNTEESSNYKKLTLKDLSEILNEIYYETMEKNKLNVTQWKYSSEYLITRTIDLNEFKENNSVSYPLKNIFKLANFQTEEEIKNKIESLLISPKNINKLEKILENSATDYIIKIWPESRIRFKFKIQNDLNLSVYIVDEADEENSFYMSDRSDGFKQFISLILSISAESNSEVLKNNVIIIDEPEIHMHPSGIKYMKNELLRIGLNNYIFLSTHSEFMVDTQNKERHYIVTKRNNNTHVSNWESGDYIPDDEILRQAFGISILRDLVSEYNLKDNNIEYASLTEKAIKTLYPELTNTIEPEKVKQKLNSEAENKTIEKNVTPSIKVESSGAIAQKFKDFISKAKECLDNDKNLQTSAQKR